MRGPNFFRNNLAASLTCDNFPLERDGSGFFGFRPLCLVVLLGIAARPMWLMVSAGFASYVCPVAIVLLNCVQNIEM